LRGTVRKLRRGLDGGLLDCLGGLGVQVGGRWAGRGDRRELEGAAHECGCEWSMAGVAIARCALNCLPACFPSCLLAALTSSLLVCLCACLPLCLFPEFTQGPLPIGPVRTRIYEASQPASCTAKKSCRSPLGALHACVFMHMSAKSFWSFSSPSACV
jgi:hypothetical protein